MPYNLIEVVEGKARLTHCRSATEALVRLDAAVEGGETRVVSVEGVELPRERLEYIARAETASASPPKRAA